MSDDLDKSLDEIHRTYGWRARLERFRAHLDKLPDQRRRVPTWTPITEINPKWRDRLDGIEKREIDGVAHYALGARSGPRANIEKEIESAEQAGEAGDLDRFAQAIHRIVGDFFEAGVEIFVEADYRKRQSKNRKGKPVERRKGVAARGFMAYLEEFPETKSGQLIADLESDERELADGSYYYVMRLDEQGDVEVWDGDTDERDSVPRDNITQKLSVARQYLKDQQQARRRKK